ncbi:MAG: DNA cytosine methyltransferase [Pseudomonadota bacterium]
MEGYYIKKIGQNKGAPRVWLEGTETARAGFAPGTRYDVEVQGQMIVLQANTDGSRVVSGKVIGERNNPIIDLNSKELLAMFDGMAAIRIVVKKDQIYLLPLASEIKKRERFARIRDKLEKGEPLALGSLSHGGGILSHAIHAGLKHAGIESTLRFANEIRGELLEHADAHNDAWTANTQVIAAPMQELAFDDRGVASLPKVDILEAGIPCSGTSRSGRSKLGLAHGEAHPHVGHLVVSALVIVSKTNPAIVCIENVPEYGTSASADILRNQFRDMGYTTHERILNGKQWGSLENRNRWCMLAVTDGIEFDFDQLQPPGPSLQLIADIVDPTIGPDDPCWRTFNYLKTKEVRDQEKGNSFAMQVVTGEGDSVSVMRKGYAKGGSTDPLLRHPTNPELMRQFTPEEHARIKGVPASLIEGLSNTIAHQVLGQGIVYEPFKAVGAHVGNSLNILQGKPGAPLVKRSAVLNITPNSEATVRVVQAAHEPLQQNLFAEPVVMQGAYSGIVMDVVDNIVIQKINRQGETVKHDHRALTKSVLTGEVIDITYQNGIGKVGGKTIDASIGR